MKTDEELRQDVMDEFKWDPELKKISTEIGVAAKDGVITLSGAVGSYWKKISAEKAAQRVKGVKVVACDIHVKVGSIGKWTDTEVAEAIRNALRWNSAVNEDHIKVRVDNGWIYLEGEVEFDHERRYAEQSVEDIVGVSGVTNNIRLRTQPMDTKDLLKKIKAAYHRSATVDSSSIQIETAGNKLTLRGKVRSWTEKHEAEKIAWATPGVLSVDNRIDIDLEELAGLDTPEAQERYYLE